MEDERTKIKRIRFILPAETLDMGGFPVQQALPTQKVQQLDPFLLLHHAHTKYSKRRLAKHQGIGPHPHRGFSPVTFVVEGEVHHRDSWGNDQIAKAGAVQWMHAGAGIVHSERPSQALVEAKGKQEIIQLWINSPSKNKMIPPEYAFISEERMPIFTSSDTKIKNKLVAGNYMDLKGKINTQSALLVIWGNAREGGEQQIQVPKKFNSMLYLIKGSVVIKGHGLMEKEQLAIFELEGEQMEMKFKEESQFLILCGLPIDEEVTQSGPYVMNNQTQILEAMRDYQMGKMGVLIEEDDQNN